MIQVSKKEDYAIILLNELIDAVKSKPLPLSEVAQKHQLSILFLRKIALLLRNAGIIRAIEGKQGGYLLAKKPEDIQLGKVLESLSTKSLFSCCQDTKDGKCSVKTCPHGLSIRRVNNQLLEKIYTLSLKDLKSSHSL